VLSYLDPEQSAEILSQFPEQVRLDLIMRIANLEEVQPAALQELNDIMEKQFAGAAGAQAAKMGGLKAAANIMNDHSGGNNGQLPTHAYVHWAATELLAVFAPAFPLSLLRQEIRPQAAQAHSLGRYGQ
jgi:hypothetical protein